MASSRAARADKNPQTRSVGNLGDVLKHAALFEISSLLARSASTVHWVDTHAFLLHAPMSDQERWDREVEALLERSPAYARYVAHERASIARTGHYRCSSGLVLDMLGERRVSATLGEANGLTRAELRDQVAAERLEGVVVVDDARTALQRATSDVGGGLLIHVDPFSLTAEVWAELAPSLDALCAGASEAVLVAYRYTRQARSPWPAAPKGTTGPIAETRGGPHEIAVYASASAVQAIRGVCMKLGWLAPPRD
ncbi:MAG: hypothetical protein HOV80_35280 [Polyangiaceae bacterium]|nr:hypothetical protein [Polyangiaceae bacterium]